MHEQKRYLVDDRKQQYEKIVIFSYCQLLSDLFNCQMEIKVLILKDADLLFLKSLQRRRLNSFLTGEN